MVKKMNLADSLKKASEPQKITPVKPSEPEQKETQTEIPPSRAGKKVIAGHFDPAVSKQLRQLALEHDSTVQALLTEAINDLFVKHRRPPIA